MNDAGVYIWVGIFIIGLAVGIRASVRQTRRYRRVRPHVSARDSLLLLGPVLGSWVIVVFASYTGLLSIRRGLGFAPMDWTPLVTGLGAAGILYLPALFDVLQTRIERDGRR